MRLNVPCRLYSNSIRAIFPAVIGSSGAILPKPPVAKRRVDLHFRFIAPISGGGRRAHQPSVDHLDSGAVTRRQRHGFQAAADGPALPEAGGLGADDDGTAGDSNLDGPDAVAHGLLNLLLDPPLGRGLSRRVGAGLDGDRAAGSGGLVARARWAQKPAEHG